MEEDAPVEAAADEPDEIIAVDGRGVGQSEPEGAFRGRHQDITVPVPRPDAPCRLRRQEGRKDEQAQGGQGLCRE